jgi:hypothetical protein
MWLGWRGISLYSWPLVLEIGLRIEHEIDIKIGSDDIVHD